jgi:L-galactose dehydrogenase
MEYRSLGNTGLKVSKLAFGGSSLGSVFRSVTEADGIRTVHAALDHGINLIDTAPFYGLTKAETVLGKALRDVPRDRYLLATKVGRYGYKEEDFDFTAARVTASIDESLERLGCDHIDFIQVHDMEFGSIERIVGETLPALRSAQKEGKVRFVGITCLPVHLFVKVMDQVDVDQIQSYCHYALNDTALADILPYLKAKGVGIFNSAPLAMRLLTQEGPPEWHPASPGVKAKCAEAAAYCASRGADLAKLALQFSVAHPDIPTTIVGTANPERILENIRQIQEPLDEELLAGVLEILKPIHNLTWTSGRPENNRG